MEQQTIPNIKDSTLYFYHDQTFEYIGEGSTGNSDEITISLYTTFKTPPPKQDGYIRIFDTNTETWSLKKEMLCIIDELGFFVGEERCTTILESNHTFLGEDIDPPEESSELNMYYLDGSSWVIKNEYQNFISPIFNTTSKEWEESATAEEINQEIDRETEYLIKKWCKDQGKCEEYYLNRGITDSSDSEYLNYVTNKDNIIATQNALKVS